MLVSGLHLWSKRRAADAVVQDNGTGLIGDHGIGRPSLGLPAGSARARAPRGGRPRAGDAPDRAVARAKPAGFRAVPSSPSPTAAYARVDRLAGNRRPAGNVYNAYGMP